MWLTPDHQDTDFNWPLSLDDKVTLFLARTRGWQLDIAQRCIAGMSDDEGRVIAAPIPHSAFAVLHILFSYFEMIAKFHQGFVPEYPWDRRSEAYFKEGVLLVCPSLRKQPVGLMDEVLYLLYQEARCGLYHSGMTAGRIVVAQGMDAAMTYTSDDGRLWIDPRLLVLEMQDHLSDYEARLRDPSKTVLRENFEKRFDFLAE